MRLSHRVVATCTAVGLALTLSLAFAVAIAQDSLQQTTRLDVDDADPTEPAGRMLHRLEESVRALFAAPLLAEPLAAEPLPGVGAGNARVRGWQEKLASACLLCLRSIVDAFALVADVTSQALAMTAGAMPARH